MALHFVAVSPEKFYLAIGGRVGFLLDEKTFTEPSADRIKQTWMGRGMPSPERAGVFDNGLGRLKEAPTLAATTAVQAWLSFWNAFSPVTPNIVHLRRLARTCIVSLMTGPR